jgi:hypothetical protein
VAELVMVAVPEGHQTLHLLVEVVMLVRADLLVVAVVAAPVHLLSPEVQFLLQLVVAVVVAVLTKVVKMNKLLVVEETNLEAATSLHIMVVMDLTIPVTVVEEAEEVVDTLVVLVKHKVLIRELLVEVISMDLEQQAPRQQTEITEYLTARLLLRPLQYQTLLTGVIPITEVPAAAV